MGEGCCTAPVVASRWPSSWSNGNARPVAHHPNGAHIGGAHLGGWTLAVGRQVGRIIVLDTGGGGFRKPVQKVVPPGRLVDNRCCRLWITAGARRLSAAASADTHGCRIGADGRGDLARYGRPAGRAALARSGGRAVLAGKDYDGPPCRSAPWSPSGER